MGLDHKEGNIMFTIKNIFAGWMDVQFGNSDEKIISFSYIEDVKEKLDILFNLDYAGHMERTEEFDLEGEDLVIHTHLYGDKIHIFCSILGEEKEDYHYIFNYAAFLKEYYREMSIHKKIYISDFAYHELDFIWATDNWKKIEQKIK